MGLKQSKLVINTESKDAGTTHDETPGTCKLIENGNLETSAQQHEPETHANGDCSSPTEVSNAEETADEAKTKKKNPINWIQKKISFKKVRTPKKQPAVEDERVAGAAEVFESPVNTTEIETQADAPLKTDVGTGHGDPEGTDPVLEITPKINGVHQLEFEEVINHEEPACEGEIADPEVEKLPVDMDISAKLANLGLASGEVITNGHHLEDGHEEVGVDGAIDHPVENN